MADKEVPQERGCQACCCFCFSSETTIYNPGSVTQCLGSMKSQVICCFRSNEYNCICPGHQAFDGLSDQFKQSGDDICCVLHQSQSTFIKPNFLSGDLPVCKSVSKGCCCSSRAAFPRDKDAPGRCSLNICPCGFFLGCADSFGFCPLMDGVGNSSFGQSLDGNVWGGKGEYGQEYIFCNTFLPCSALSCSIPEYAIQALGWEKDCKCICLKCNAYGGLLPNKEYDGKDFENLRLDSVIACACVKPNSCCKDTTRCGFCHARSSFPCDADVPLACTVCGLKLCHLKGGENTNFETCYCHTHAKNMD